VPDHIDVPEIGPVPRKKIPGEPDFESPLETQPRPLRRAKSAGRERPGKVTRTRSKSRIRRKA
jgi:hypothetical protein